MNSLMALTLLCLTAAPAERAASAERLNLAEAGKTQATIVVPDRASGTVQHAAEELAAYLERISDAKFPIVAESEAAAGARIDVGLTGAARKSLPADLASCEERVMVRSVPGGLLVCGGSDRGTLFAVYRFLEALGCRWLAPEAEDELIPRQTTLSVSNLNIDARPAFAWRLFGGSRPQQEAWGLKVGFNGLYTAASAAHSGGCCYWPATVSGCHAYYQIMPAEKYAASHPEWNSLIDGKRQATRLQGRQLCVTAPGLADEFAANVIRLFDADPQAKLVSISPNDGYGWCQCPECLALDKQLCGARTTKQGLGREEPFMGDRVFWFANEVARRVAVKHPDRKLLVLAYVNYAEPPDTVRPGRAWELPTAASARKRSRAAALAGTPTRLASATTPAVGPASPSPRPTPRNR